VLILVLALLSTDPQVTLADLSPQVNRGTRQGSATTVGPEPSFPVASFQPGQYVRFPSASGMPTGTSARTVTLWAYIDSRAPVQDFYLLSWGVDGQCTAPVTDFSIRVQSNLLPGVFLCGGISATGDSAAAVPR
jgi:hypothetical protein